MLDLAIIIINYGTPELTKDCLNSLEEQVKDSSIKVIVIDNASKDDSVNILNKFIENKKWRSLIASKENLGFAGGNNLGIKAIEAKAYLLLNSDTVAKPGAIKELLEFADRNQNLGIISCHLEGPNGEIQTKKFRFHTPFGEFISESKFGPFYRIFKKWRVPIYDNEDTPADWVCFAAALIRKSVFDQIGLLDQKYFMYYEDVDFCMKAKEANIWIGVCNNAQIIHKIGSSSKVFGTQQNEKGRRPQYFYVARSHFFKKNFGALGLLTANILWSLGRLTCLLSKPLRIDKDTSGHRKDYLDIWIS